MSKPQSLVDTLFGEVFQTERSAVRHCSVEADRLADTPLALAMRAVSSHAARVEPELEEHARRRGVETGGVGRSVGTFFSTVRDNMADFVLTSEQSYRGTLLGMRHGCDVVALFGAAAEAEGDRELAAWCARWLVERKPLVEACANAMSWFASHPERALANAKSASG